MPPNSIVPLHPQTTRAASLFRHYVESVRPSVKELDVNELDSLMAKNRESKAETFHVFDVRETSEWNQGYIPDAFYTGRGCLERDIESLVPDTHDEIIVYCAGGVRSILAADSLQKMGYKNVKSLRGGYGAWKAAGKPVVESFKTFSDRREY
ncbi:Rhodanese-like domain-containing protein [Zopfochytrium polystomum]|nr:Rhodanese-like domain-containing protein [Zopfochytrium polystomum]